MKKNRLIIFILVACFVLSVFCFAGLNETAHAATKTVDIYAINDFHGAVDQMPKIAGYLAARKKEGAVILNSGDMFQGSMESNSNFGKLLSECMDVAGFDAFTYGNHEFDWGLDNLRNLASNSAVPFLGANIYNWNAQTFEWGEFASDLAEPYNIVEVGDVKVGVIGVIGKDQITSISSQLVQSIGFKEPLPIVKELATDLRQNKQCDVVVVSAHVGPQEFVGEGENYKKPSNAAGLQDYVDAVFCAHTHAEQSFVVDGIPFIQGKRYGDFVSHVQLSVNGNEVKYVKSENISYSNLNDIDQDVYNAVKTKIDNSNAAIATEAKQVLATLTGGNLNSQTAVPRLVCHAVAEYAAEQGYQIELAMVNNARNQLSQGNITYTSLYEAIPFDNVVYIAKVSGKDILNEAKYDSNSIWRVSGTAIENSSTKYYTIAVIDYLLYHQNSSRTYNYFPSAFRSGFTPVALTKEGVEMYNYRLLTRDFLLKTETINASNYVKDNVHTKAGDLKRSVDLPVYSSDAPSGGLPVYVIALIIVGAVLVVAATVTLVLVLVLRKKRAKAN